MKASDVCKNLPRFRKYFFFNKVSFASFFFFFFLSVTGIHFDSGAWLAFHLKAGHLDLGCGHLGCHPSLPLKVTACVST